MVLMMIKQPYQAVITVGVNNKKTAIPPHSNKWC